MDDITEKLWVAHYLSDVDHAKASDAIIDAVQLMRLERRAAAEVITKLRADLAEAQDNYQRAHQRAADNLRGWNAAERKLRIKPLEWDVVSYDPNWYYAAGVGYKYSLFLHRSGIWRLNRSSGDGQAIRIDDYVNSTEGKVAAQVDYEAQILGAMNEL